MIYVCEPGSRTLKVTEGDFADKNGGFVTLVDAACAEYDRMVTF